MYAVLVETGTTMIGIDAAMSAVHIQTGLSLIEIDEKSESGCICAAMSPVILVGTAGPTMIGIDAAMSAVLDGM